MITINAEMTATSLRLTVKGHSATGREDCARATTAFQAITYTFTHKIIDKKTADGFSYAEIAYTKQTKKMLLQAVLYLKQLAELHPKTMKFTFKENEEKNYD